MNAALCVALLVSPSAAGNGDAAAPSLPKGYVLACTALSIGQCVHGAQIGRSIERDSGLPLVILALSQRSCPASVSLPLRLSAWGTIACAGSTAALPHVSPQRASHLRFGLLLQAVASLWGGRRLSCAAPQWPLLHVGAIVLALYRCLCPWPDGVLPTVQGQPITVANAPANAALLLGLPARARPAPRAG